MFKSLLVVVIFSSLLFSQEKPKHEFVGVKTCAMCHKTEKQGNQFGIWEKSKHAQAYKTLQSAEADKIAKEKGFKTKAVETPECLKCHTSGSNVDASLLGKKFNIEDGVQCETCHGPGGDYKSIKIMKDQKAAIENGLVVPEDINTFCVKCHNSESPTFDKNMDLSKMWEKIKHTIPGEK
jgi:hypothetical protein